MSVADYERSGCGRTWSRLSACLIALMFECRLELLPEGIGWILDREKLPSGFGDGFELIEQGAAERAGLHVGMNRNIFPGPNQLRHLGLEFFAGHILGILHY